MTKHRHVTRGGRYGVAALLLIGTSAAAFAQAGDTMVTAETATHMATLTGTGEGTAWFLADPQNNTIRWTIEYTGIEATGASIKCPGPTDDAGAAPAGDAADTPTTGGLTGQIMLVHGADAGAAGADMTPAAPAAGADAGAAGGAGAGMTPAAPAAGADAGAAAGMDAGAMSGDMAGLVEAVNLLQAGGTMASPLDGQTADLDDTVFAHISSGACFLELTVAATG
ncbi:MAG: hypothetical protein KIT43_10795 [Bauldia sp.]|nr:hypothetical protein [Bauldia sp.]MCW5717670.1 hypothetical protein [Bauldia sp.]